MEPGFLRRAKVKSALSRRNYVEYSNRFRTFANEQGFQIPADGHSVELDAGLEKFCEKEALEGNGIFASRMAVYGEAWRRGLNLRLPKTLALSRAALTGWANAVPGNSRDPLPWICACDMAAWLLQQKTPVHIQSAKCLLISFDTYVRPGVSVDLCDFNLVLPNRGVKAAYDKTALILCPSSEGSKTTKTGERDDTIIVGVHPDRKFVGKIVQQLGQETQQRGGGRLFPNLALKAYEKSLREAGKACGYSFKVCPHMARHGGPSTDRFEEKLTLEEIQKRGMWNSFNSVMRYEKHGRLLKVLKTLSPAALLRAQKAATDLQKTFRI